MPSRRSHHAALPWAALLHNNPLPPASLHLICQVHYDIVLGAIAGFVESMLPARLSAQEKAAWSRVLAVIKLTAAPVYADPAQKQAAAQTAAA